MRLAVVHQRHRAVGLQAAVEHDLDAAGVAARLRHLDAVGRLA
jgi:hypothetical protein